MPAGNWSAVAFWGNFPRLAETLNDMATGGVLNPHAVSCLNSKKFHEAEF